MSLRIVVKAVEGLAARGTLVHVEPGSLLEARYGGPSNLREPEPHELAAYRAGHGGTSALGHGSRPLPQAGPAGAQLLAGPFTAW